MSRGSRRALAQAGAAAQGEPDQPVDQRGVVEPGGGPHPGEHRGRGEARHGVDLVDHQRPVGHHEEVDPGQALAADRLEGARRELAELGGGVVGQVGRDVELGVLLGEVLRGEVVELVLAADPDLGRHAGLRRAVERLEHAALDLARARRPPARPAPSGRGGAPPRSPRRARRRRAPWRSRCSSPRAPASRRAGSRGPRRDAVRRPGRGTTRAP